jgi:hypothetical protein
MKALTRALPKRPTNTMSPKRIGTTMETIFWTITSDSCSGTGSSPKFFVPSVELVQNAPKSLKFAVIFSHARYRSPPIPTPRGGGDATVPDISILK